jgi:hypothetical protein
MNDANRPREPGPEEAWLHELLTSEAEAYGADSDGLRAAVRRRIEAGTPRVRIRDRRAGHRLQLTSVAVGIGLAALCAAVATTVGMLGRHEAATPGSTLGAGDAAPTASGHAESDASAKGATDFSGSPLPVGGPDVSAINRSSALSSSRPSAGASTSPHDSASGPTIISSQAKVSSGSNRVWSEEDVMLSLSEPVSSFRLTVRVSMTPLVSSTGWWTTDNPSQFDVTVDARSDGLYYTFLLMQGQTLPAGAATFAVQFKHGDGTHNPAADSYFVNVTTDATHGSATAASSSAF